MEHIRESARGYDAGGKGHSAKSNITLSLPDALLVALKERAADRGQSVNQLVRRLIEHELGVNPWMGLVELARSIPPQSRGDRSKWSREDLYKGNRFGDAG